MSIDSPTQQPATTIWQELDSWARTFKPWQRFVLATAVRVGKLTDSHVDQAYALLLHDYKLAAAPNPPVDVPATISGRPAAAAPSPLWLARIGDLQGVNALPAAAELLFSPALTVIYGGNGAGKSGFTRVLSNVCFSRNQHRILPNVYETSSPARPSATIVVDDGSQNKQTFAFDGISEFPELKRIAVFDTAVAHTHLAEQNALSFKPAGFDVFPEMARVYGLLTARLAADIERRTRTNNFPSSFVAPESPISQLVAKISGTSDITELRGLAVFTEVETARLDEVQRQITELKAKSPADTIKQLEATKENIRTLLTCLAEVEALISVDQRAEYRSLIDDFTAKARAVSARGTESFQHGGVGSSEWQQFLAAAHTLAQSEHADYPHDDDLCLLCQRPLDAPSASLIRRLWGFLASDVTRAAEEANVKIQQATSALTRLRFDFFAPSTIACANVTRLNPSLARQLTELIAALDADRAAIIAVLKDVTGTLPVAVPDTVSAALISLQTQIDADIARIKEQKVEDALKALEAERVTLRHRQVLHQLFPQIESFVSDLAWVKVASGSPRGALNTRPLTAKETEFFGAVVVDEYSDRFGNECGELDCKLPVEFRTQGQRGQTVRSLSIKGGHSPDSILSEGEQRAVALADFLTEVSLNPASAGIVLDDPVTSQDHQRKELIACRLVKEASTRQVIIFTHDLVFLMMLSEAAAAQNIELLTHWIERTAQGLPGQISLDDSPATTAQYRDTSKAQKTLAEAKTAAGSDRLRLIQRGMGELRRTIEEIIPHHLLKQVVTRWTDRVIVTGLKKVNWDDEVIKDIIQAYEDISAFIEGHSHTEERSGAPPEPKDLETMIDRVKDLIKRSKSEKKKG